MALSSNSSAQMDPLGHVKAIQEAYNQKQTGLQLQLDALNLKIQALTHQINSSIAQDYVQPLTAACGAREELLKEQNGLSEVQALFGQIISLKNREIELDLTIQRLRHQIAARKENKLKLETDILELTELKCDVAAHCVLAEKWVLEISTSSQALEETKLKRRELDDQIKNVIRQAFKLCAQWGMDPLIGGSGRDKLPQII